MQDSWVIQTSNFITSRKKSSAAAQLFLWRSYNVSYTDVYDFASAGNKKSLKKLEIEMGIHHQELGLPWDQPVPEELWTKVAEYCDNDVIATEAAFHYLKADWTARQILADCWYDGERYNQYTYPEDYIWKRAETTGSVQLQKSRRPVHYLDGETKSFLAEACPEMMAQTHGDEGSLLPYFSWI